MESKAWVAMCGWLGQSGCVNLPNAITFSRLLLAAVFVWALDRGGAAGSLVALVTFSVAAATDWLDGYLARKLGLVTPLGKLLDPLADKILVCAAFVFMSTLGFAPVWVTALIIAREFLVTGLRQIAVEAGQVLAADRLGKWKTTFQLTYVITALVWISFSEFPARPWVFEQLWLLAKPAGQGGWLMPVSLWLAVALTLVSGANYVWSSRRLLVGKA
jgi:CDP-diacylglycerol--glycerol-3-phosphate 3-phosphatidyltransferase